MIEKCPNVFSLTKYFVYLLLHSDCVLGVFQVWFKNRRARRKRQGGGSKVKSPQRSQTQIFNTVL